MVSYIGKWGVFESVKLSFPRKIQLHYWPFHIWMSVNYAPIKYILISLLIFQLFCAVMKDVLSKCQCKVTPKHPNFFSL